MFIILFYARVHPQIYRLKVYHITLPLLSANIKNRHHRPSTMMTGLPMSYYIFPGPQNLCGSITNPTKLWSPILQDFYPLLLQAVVYHTLLPIQRIEDRFFLTRLSAISQICIQAFHFCIYLRIFLPNLKGAAQKIRNIIMYKL